MYTFKKEERLCNKRLIDGLFRNGSSFLCYPFRVAWMPVTEPLPAPAQIVLTVAKKRYKRATDRNLVKRRMREAYRLYKQEHLYRHLQQQEMQIVLSIGYIGKEITDFGFMEKKMLKLLTQLNQAFYANPDATV